jgi:hypothetical protein
MPPHLRRLLVLSKFSDRISFDLLSSDGSSLQHTHSPISLASRSSPRHLRAALLHTGLGLADLDLVDHRDPRLWRLYFLIFL